MECRYKLDYPAIAKRIKAARRAAQLTQAELAEKINISTNAVAKLETNLMNVSLQTLISIANVLNIDMNYLLSDGKGTGGENTDLFLESLLADLSTRDKAFLIHTINGLKANNAEREESDR